MKYDCRTCGKAITAEAVGVAGAGRDFPFCSERCRMADLNAWIESEYRIVTEDVDAAGSWTVGPDDISGT